MGERQSNQAREDNKVNKIINFPIIKDRDLNDLAKSQGEIFEVFIETYIKKLEIENLEFEINDWDEYVYEFPYLTKNKNQTLDAFELVRTMIVGLHLHFSSRALKEYKTALIHFKNFDFHDLAKTLRALIELSMMMFYITHRIEKALMAKDVKSLLQIIIRASFATRQKIIFPNDFSRFFLNKLGELGLNKEKTFHINDAFEYFWQNSTTIKVDLENNNGDIKKEDWVLGGKQFSEINKKNFISFYNLLSEEVHPLGMLSSLPNKEYFFQEEINNGFVQFLNNVALNIDTFGFDKEQKLLSFGESLRGNIKNFQISFISTKLRSIYYFMGKELDNHEFNNTVKNILGEELILNPNKKLTKEELMIEIQKIKLDYPNDFEGIDV